MALVEARLKKELERTWSQMLDKKKELSCAIIMSLLTSKQPLTPS
jgi:hypothetical protein